MKVTLIRYHDKDDVNTPLPKSLIQGVLPPLGIAYIASSLERAGHKVRIIDAVAMNYTKQDVKDILLRDKPELAGVTTMTPTVKGALEACRIAKECGCVVVIGGPHVEIYPKETLSYDFVDYGILGEGEESVVELANAIQAHIPVDGIQGLAYKSNGQIMVNEPRIVENLDGLLFPARHLLPMDKYCATIRSRVATMITSRGCPYKCGFCCRQQASDKKARARSAGNVVDEMEQVAKDYGVQEIMFYDDTMTLKRQHVAGICEEILRRGLKIKWEATTRVNHVDKELLNLMSRAGCFRLRYGVESGDPEILKLMHKQIDIQTIKNVFRWTREAGINTFAYFLVAYPDETEEQMKKTISLAKELKADFAMFCIATPYAKTHLYELALEKGLLHGDYWSEFTLGLRNDRLPYFHPDAEKWVRQAYRSFYMRPGFIFKSLLDIRTLGDVKKRFDAVRSLLKV